MKVSVLIDSINKVKDFVKITSESKVENIDIKSGRHVVDAKSIMGLFSLNLSDPVELTIEHDDDIEVENLLNDLSAFIVK